jgi:hypothetical protein
VGKQKQEDPGPGHPGHKVNPVSKITEAKRAGNMAQMVELLPSKCEAQSSKPNTTKKERKRVQIAQC